MYVQSFSTIEAKLGVCDTKLLVFCEQTNTQTDTRTDTWADTDTRMDGQKAEK